MKLHFRIRRLRFFWIVKDFRVGGKCARENVLKNLSIPGFTYLKLPSLRSACWVPAFLPLILRSCPNHSLLVNCTQILSLASSILRGREVPMARSPNPQNPVSSDQSVSPLVVHFQVYPEIGNHIKRITKGRIRKPNPWLTIFFATMLPAGNRPKNRETTKMSNSC